MARMFGGRVFYSAAVLLAGMAVLLLSAGGAAAQGRAEGAPSFSGEDLAATKRNIERRWPAIEQIKEGAGVRDLFGFLLEAAATSWHPERYERIVDLMAKAQDRNKASETYGNLVWYWGNPKVGDRNAVEFSMEVGSLTWKFYADRLPPAARAKFKEVLELGVEGIRRHKVRVSYTNIFVMKCWNLVALGEALGRKDVADEGYQLFDTWLACTYENGVCEYLSPTYYGVDLADLTLLAKYAGRPQGRQAAQAALRYMATEIAANWFAPAQRLGGAHSRDYDYLTGRGLLDTALVNAEFLPASTLVSRRGGVIPRFTQWTFPRDVAQGPAAAVPRYVAQRWGEQPLQRARQYVGKQFCLGSAGAAYHNMDKPLAMSWAGDPTAPMLNFFMDGRGDPYGKSKIKEGAGGPESHSKALHLIPVLASLQQGPEVLLAASLDMNARNLGHNPAEITQLASQLVLPLPDKLWIGEREVTASEVQKPVAVPAGAPVVFQKGDVLLGVRVLLAADAAGNPAPVELNFDGRSFGAMRLTCLHAANKPAGRYHVAILVRADETVGATKFRAAFAAVQAQASLQKSQLAASCQSNLGAMKLVIDPRAGKVLSQEGGQPADDNYLLCVNGKELGRDLLKPFAQAYKPEPAAGKKKK